MNKYKQRFLLYVSLFVFLIVFNSSLPFSSASLIGTIIIIFIVDSILSFFIVIAHKISKKNNVDLEGTQLMDNIETKSKIKGFLKIILITIAGFILVYFLFSLYSKSLLIEAIFGSRQNYEEYKDIDKKYNDSYEGEYESCLSLDPEQKQFCLWLAYENTKEIEICNNMDPDLYPADHPYSKENCVIDIAIYNGNEDICNDVVQKKSCNDTFKRIKVQKDICSNLFDGNYPPIASDCFNYGIEQKSKEICDLFVDAGGLNYKDLCYLEAGLVSDKELSIVPTEMNQCVYTKITNVAEGVELLNGVILKQKDSRMQIGNLVRLCLKGDSCPGNYRYKGTVYDYNDYTGGFSGLFSTSIEECD